jgi:hypothetical protein
MVLGIKQYCDSLLAGNKITDAVHGELALVLSDPSAFRKVVVCERAGGSEYSKPSCVAAQCSSCSDLQRVVSFFGGAEELVFGSSGFNFSQIEGRDLNSEDAVGLEEVQKTQVDGICYKRLTKTLHWRKDGTQKENKEFLEREVTLGDFWSNFKSFFPDLLTHHDLSKSQGREFASLESYNPDTCKPVLQKGEVRGVIDFIQRLTIKRGAKETQQEFFAQNGCTLLVGKYTDIIFCCSPLPCADAPTAHRCTHRCTHQCTHRCAHPPMRPPMHPPTDAPTHRCAHQYTHPLMHPPTNAPTNAPTHR